MIDSTNPRVMADNIRALSANQAAQGATLEAEIEALGFFSSDEVDTGMEWIDGSPIYRKVIYVEELPGNNSVAVPHNITNLGVIVNSYGLAQIKGASAARPLPYAGTNLYNITETSIYFPASSSYTTGQSAYITLEYTKSAAPTPDVSPSPDPDTRALEEVEPEPEPIEEKK